MVRWEVEVKEVAERDVMEVVVVMEMVRTAGMAGAETLLPLALMLVRDERITLPRLFALLARNPAKVLGLDTGTLEPGKDADFVILDGPPFSVWTHVEETYVDGTRTFSRADEPRLSTGGYDVADRYPGGAR